MPYIFSYLSETPWEVPEEIDAGINVEEDVIFNFFSEKLSFILSTLPPRVQKCLKMRFGLEGYKEMSLSRIGQYFNVAPATVSQIEAKGLRMLRISRRSKYLQDFIE